LLGSIAIVMMLYYLVNWPDPDIRRYSYEVISSTVSIFCAVLLFQTFNDLIHTYLLEGRPLAISIIVNFIHQLGWFTGLQFLLMLISKGGAGNEKKREQIIEGPPDQMEAIEMNLKCWGVLLSHITGFAAINSYGAIQQLHWFKSDPEKGPFRCLMVVPMALVGNLLVQYVSDKIRKGFQVTQEDDEIDELEKRWNEEVEEAENDVSGLALSFLVNQSLRYWIGGTLANAEGEEEGESQFSHTTGQVMKLYLWALVFLACTVGLLLYGQHREEAAKQREEAAAESGNTDEQAEAAEEEERAKKIERFNEIFIAGFSMSFAWSVFYGTRWAWSASQICGNNATLLGVVLAVSLSGACFLSIYFLDKLADAEFTPEAVDNAIVQMISAIGILVGFSWEQSFDAAVAALASRTTNPHMAKLFLALFSVLLLAPAWKQYILPMVIQNGWRFGFICTHVTRNLDPQDQECITEYEKMIEHLCSLGERKKEIKREKQNRQGEHASAEIRGKSDEVTARWRRGTEKVMGMIRKQQLPEELNPANGEGGPRASPKPTGGLGFASVASKASQRSQVVSRAAGLLGRNASLAVGAIFRRSEDKQGADRPIGYQYLQDPTVGREYLKVDLL